MKELIEYFAESLNLLGYFNNLDLNDKLFYKNSKLKTDNEWYVKCRVANEILNVEKELDSLIDCYCEDTVLHALLKNKNTIYVSSMSNKSFSLLDYFFCEYLKQQNPHLEINISRMVPVDKYNFFDFDNEYLGGNVTHVDFPRTKMFAINISESEVGAGHIFFKKNDCSWRWKNYS